MKIAIAYEENKKSAIEYLVWFLETNIEGVVIDIGVKTKEEVFQSCFTNYQLYGQTDWRAFEHGSEKSRLVEITDFIAIKQGDNTHVGNLPTISEFQTTIDALKFNLRAKNNEKKELY